MPYRNLAVAYYSHLDRRGEVLELLRRALSKHPGDDQLIYEISYVIPRLGLSAEEKLKFLQENFDENNVEAIRDDICIEWAKAYNQNNQPEKALNILLNHIFIPCEGGEHAVADQYMFAHYNLGRQQMKEHDFESALVHFRAAQTLPDNLGVGLWHEAKLVPMQFYEACCLKKLGDIQQAYAIYQHILNLTIDYFSDMHLCELPYFQALSWDRLGNPVKGQALINKFLHKWQNECRKENNGYFKTTPFFISYCEDPISARTAHYSYLSKFHILQSSEIASSRLLKNRFTP